MVNVSGKTVVDRQYGTLSDEAMVGEGVQFKSTARITGYLVGETTRWNEGKKAELKDRVKHGIQK